MRQLFPLSVPAPLLAAYERQATLYHAGNVTAAIREGLEIGMNLLNEIELSKQESSNDNPNLSRNKTS